jgi:CheY-like chemotaxis protein
LAAVPLVVMSVVGDIQRQAVALGAVACLGKPVDLNDLVALAAYYC